MSKKFLLGVVGYGYIGKRHARIIRHSEETELTGIAEINTALRSDIETTEGVPFFPSLEAFLDSEQKPELIHICTPNGFHASQTIQALHAGCHVVVEKPMALTVAEGQQMIDAAQRAGKNIYCVLQNRFSPVSAWLKEMMTENRLGKIFWVEINCFWNRDERYYQPNSWRGTLQYDGGPLFTQYSHFLDILYWVFGEMTDVRAQFENFTHRHNTEFEDTGSVSFRLKKSGAMGAIHYSNAVYDRNFESSIRVIGEKGTIQIGGQYMNEVTYCHVKDYILPILPPSAPANQYEGYTGSADHHALVVQNVLKHLKGESVNEAVNATDGLKVVELIEQIYRMRNSGIWLK